MAIHNKEEAYEQSSEEQAYKIERAKLNISQAEELQRQVEEVKGKSNLYGGLFKIRRLKMRHYK